MTARLANLADSDSGGTTPQGRRGTLPYRADIDGLRSLAVMLVLLFHFEIGEIWRAGFIGVDMFFVISGFLIVTLIERQVDDGRFRFADFYAARIRRLAPALIVTVTLTGAAGLVVLTPHELVSLAEESIASQLYVSNIYFWRFLNYFGLQADQSFFLHTWSLGVEEQFYIIFPACLWLILRRCRRWRDTFLLTVLVGSFALNLIMVGLKPQATFYLLPTRAWEFAAGALVPRLAQLLSRGRLPAGLYSAAGLLILVVSLAIYRGDVPFPGWFAAAPVAGTALLLASGSSESWYSRTAANPAAVYIGRISYELYLIHWPLRVFAPMLFLDYSIAVRLAALGLCFMLASAIYHLVEAPIRHRRWLPNNAPMVTVYAGATAALLLGMALVLHTGGLPGRLDGQALRMAAGSRDTTDAYRPCERRPSNPCVIGAAGRSPTWLIFGDSHADALAEAFETYLRSQGASGYFTFASGCLPLVTGGDAQCEAFNVAVRAFLDEHPEVRIVGLVSTWRQPLEQHFTNARGELVEGKQALSAFASSLDQSLAHDRRGGRRVVVWLPIPGARRPVGDTLARNEMFGRRWNIEYDRAEYNRTFNFLTNHLARYPEVQTISPANHLCTPICAVVADGRPLYYDNAHPAASHASLYAEMIRRDLARR